MAEKGEIERSGVLLLWQLPDAVCECKVRFIEPRSIFGLCRECHVQKVQKMHGLAPSPSIVSG